LLVWFENIIICEKAEGCLLLTTESVLCVARRSRSEANGSQRSDVSALSVLHDYSHVTSPLPPCLWPPASVVPLSRVDFDWWRQELRKE
jgi:hypothetical protein